MSRSASVAPDRLPPTMIASSIHIASCEDPACKSVHIQLLDADGDCFASAAVELAVVPLLVEAILDERDRAEKARATVQ